MATFNDQKIGGGDFSDASRVVGEFLPKVYTKRITVESTRNVRQEIYDRSRNQSVNRFTRREPRSGLATERSFSVENNLAESVFKLESLLRRSPNYGQNISVKIDYHIKDVLSDESIGLITRRDSEQGNLERDFAEGLTTVMILFLNKKDFTDAYKQINMQSKSGYIENFSNRISGRPEGREPRLDDYLNRIKVANVHKVMEFPAKPSELNYSLINSVYQEYDANNNPINIIPQSRTEVVPVTEFLGLICFTRFDFRSLGFDPSQISEADMLALNNLTSELTADIILEDNKVKSTSVQFRELNGNPYYGPVHRMTQPNGSNVYMTGLQHNSQDSQRELELTYVPMTKIQDFRTVQRSMMINYEPPVFESFQEKMPSTNYILRNNKDYFRLENLSVELDKRFKHTDIQFSVNMADIFKFNSKYYDLVRSMSPELQETILSSMEIKSIEILRKRVTKYEIGTNRLGSPKKVDFDQQELPTTIVARSGQPSDGLGNGEEVIEKFHLDNKGNLVGMLREMDANQIQNNAGITNSITINQAEDNEYYRSFFARDYSANKLWSTDGVYQYGVKIKVTDNTANIFQAVLSVAHKQISILKRYLEECQIPVFDIRNIKPVEHVTSATIFDTPAYAENIGRIGSYDTINSRFTNEFIAYAMRKYFLPNDDFDLDISSEDEIPELFEIEDYAEIYNTLVRLSFGKSHAELSRGSIYSLPSEENGMLQSISAYEKLQKNESFSLEGSLRTIMNMIHPMNSRPEMIQSFITSYEDMVLEIQNYFDFPVQETSLAGGKSISSKTTPANEMEVQRWFSGMNPESDSDNYIYLDSTIDKEIYFEYDIGEWVPNGPRVIPRDLFVQAIADQANSYGAIATDVAALVPSSLVIGSDIIHFNKDEEGLKKAEILEEQYARVVPNYVPKRIISINPGVYSFKSVKTSAAVPTIGDSMIKYTKEEALSTINHFVSTVSKLPTATAAAAISKVNKFATEDFSVKGPGNNYFLFVDSVIEKFEDNNVDYGSELFDFNTLLDPNRRNVTEIECEGIVLQRSEDDEPAEDLAEQYYREQTTTPEVTYNRRPRPKPVFTVPGLRRKDLVKVLDKERKTRYNIPQLRTPVIDTIPTILTGVVTLEKPAPQFVSTRLPTEVTVGTATSSIPKVETFNLSTKRVEKDLKVGNMSLGVKITPAVPKLTVKPMASSVMTTGLTSTAKQQTKASRMNKVKKSKRPVVTKTVKSTPTKKKQSNKKRTTSTNNRVISRRSSSGNTRNTSNSRSRPQSRIGNLVSSVFTGRLGY